MLLQIMPKLTQIRLGEINDVLDDSFFTSAGFTVQTFDEVDRFVHIQLRDDDRYYTTLRHEIQQRSAFELSSARLLSESIPRVLVVIQAPGDFTEVEHREIGTFEDFLGALRTWTSRLKNEILLVDVFHKKLEEFQADLNRRLDEHVRDGDAHFTKQERDDLFAKLRDFQNKISDLEKTASESKAEIKQIREIIADLKRAAYKMSKRAWLRTACNKLYAISLRALTSKPSQKLVESEIQLLIEGSLGVAGSEPKARGDNNVKNA